MFELHKGWVAPGVVWPIDSTHQRWAEASIKSTGASLLWWWGVVWAIFPLHYVCVSVWMCWSVMSYWATVLLYTPLWETVCESNSELLFSTKNTHTRINVENGYDSARKRMNPTRASRRLSMTCNTSNEFTPATAWQTHHMSDFLSDLEMAAVIVRNGEYRDGNLCFFFLS